MNIEAILKWIKENKEDAGGSRDAWEVVDADDLHNFILTAHEGRPLIDDDELKCPTCNRRFRKELPAPQKEGSNDNT